MNRQVPEIQEIKPVAIIGNGKVARHMMHYLASTGQPYTQWFRSTKPGSVSAPDRPLSRLARYKNIFQYLFKSPPSLESVVADVQTVVLLLPDDQIEFFIDQHPILESKTLVHFSGSLNSRKAIACHPLMTFGQQFYSTQRYQEFPFVVDEDVDFSRIFPTLNNPVHTIKPADKALYHAYCVMAGNFSQMLWKNIQQGMQQINLPVDLMSAYLQQNTENFINGPENSITGPMARGDMETIAKHQKALLGHPLEGIYQSFVELNQLKQQPPKRNQI